MTKEMTLRDWFAGQALAGFMSNPNIDAERLSHMPNAEEEVAKRILKIADAMLAAREVKP